MKDSNLHIVKTLFDEMNNKIEYCHWKSNQHFEGVLQGIDDLDVLINRNQYPQFISLLNDLSFKRFYTPNARSYVGIEDYLGFDEFTGSIVHLHLHYQLVLGENHLKGFLFPIEKKVLDNRVWDKEKSVYFSDPRDELILLILRMAMKNRKRDIFKSSVVDDTILNEFDWLRKRCPDFINYVETTDWLTNRIKSKVKDIFLSGFSWRRCRELMHYIYKDLYFYSQGNELHNTIKRNLKEIQRIQLEVDRRYLKSKYKLLRRRSATGGILVAFLGSDGAGKSTSIKEIEKWLFTVVDVRYFYLGSGDGKSSIIRSPLKLTMNLAKKIGIIKKANNFYREDLREDTNSRKKLDLLKRIWVYALSAERIQKLTSAYRCRQYGYVVLTDRYPQIEFSGLCDGRRLTGESGISAKKEEEAFRIAHLCPPDLVIKLIVSPEVAMKRKPAEITYETSKNLTERVKLIRFSERTKLVEIDADRPINQVLRDIKREIWACL